MKNVKLVGEKNLHKVVMGSITVWFSYETPIAFEDANFNRVVRENDWGTTTGKHLNSIDGGDKKSRVPGDTFELMLTERLTKLQFA